MNADPMTVAYIAMGAQTAILAEQKGTPAGFGVRFAHWENEMGFIEEIIQHAARLDARCEELIEAGDWGGVFLYEVAQPFGEMMARAMLETGTDADAVAIAEELFRGCA